MADLKTYFLGIELKNPIIAGASELTANMDKIKKIEDAGAAAIVIKSLFEEQIQLERYKLEENLSKYDDIHAEMVTLFPKLEHAGTTEHLMWVRKTKESVNIPVFASLNAVNKEVWIEYAKQLAETGVDGLELNFYAMPTDFKITGSNIEDEQVEILNEIKKSVSIPVSVKLSPFYTNPLQFISRLDRENVNGFVIFNRFFQPEIDVNSKKHSFPFNLSEQINNRLPLRFVGLLYGKVKGDICASTGIFEGKDVVKMLLAGANCVQVVSTLYKNGIDHISGMVNEINEWMETNGYASVNNFTGKLSRKNCDDPWAYKRAQYVNMLLHGNPLQN